MLWLRWVRLINDNAVPKYQHLVSSEAAFDDILAQWRQRFYTLGIVYIVTVLSGIVAFLFKSGSVASVGRTIRTDAIFGDSEWSFLRYLTDCWFKSSSKRASSFHTKSDLWRCISRLCDVGTRKLDALGCLATTYVISRILHFFSSLNLHAIIWSTW